jgi:hypothetical protein
LPSIEQLFPKYTGGLSLRDHHCRQPDGSSTPL